MNRTVFEVAKEFIEANDYLILDCDDRSITIKEQMSTISIFPDRTDPNFCSVILPNFADVDDDNRYRMTLFFNVMNATQKVVKAYITDSDVPVISYEFNLEDEQDVAYHVKKGIESVIAASPIPQNAL